MHGFLVLSDEAEFCYKCDDTYHPSDECGLVWEDPDLAVAWSALEGDDAFGPAKVILSDEDRLHPGLMDLR